MTGVDTIVKKLAQLGLHGMAAAVEKQRGEPKFTSMPFEQRLSLLIEQEVLSKDTRKIARLLKKAKLRYSQAVLEDIDYRNQRGLDPMQIQSLASGDWMRQKQNLILTGATGTGKSWIACAFGHQACRQGLGTLYMPATRLFEDLTKSLADGSLPKFRRQLVGSPLLIIDDLGIGGIPQQLGPTLLDILDQQSMVGSLIITSQYPVSKWYSLFDDPTIADAILDRIIHRAHPIEQYLKPDVCGIELERKTITNIKFYVAMMVALDIVGGKDNMVEKISGIPFIEIASETLERSLKLVLDKFNELDGTDQVAKSPQLVGALLS